MKPDTRFSVPAIKTTFIKLQKVYCHLSLIFILCVKILYMCISYLLTLLPITLVVITKYQSINIEFILFLYI